MNSSNSNRDDIPDMHNNILFSNNDMMMLDNEILKDIQSFHFALNDNLTSVLAPTNVKYDHPSSSNDANSIVTPPDSQDNMFKSTNINQQQSSLSDDSIKKQKQQSNRNNNKSTNNLAATASTHTGKIKRSCEECSRAKVKCSSTFPKCTRCSDRNVNCIYVEELKRGRRDTQLKNSPITAQRQLLPSTIAGNDPISMINPLSSSSVVVSPSSSSAGVSNLTNSTNNNKMDGKTKRKSMDMDKLSAATQQQPEKIYRIVNGTPETIIRDLQKSSQEKRDAETVFNQQQEPVIESITHIDKYHQTSDNSKSTAATATAPNKDTNPLAIGTKQSKKQKIDQQAGQMSSQKQQKLQPLEMNDYIQQISTSSVPKARVEESPSVNFSRLDISSVSNKASPAISAVEHHVVSRQFETPNQLTKNEIYASEKKIFTCFCELMMHLRNSSAGCSCGGCIPLSQQKMNNFLFVTDQLSRFVGVSKEVEQNLAIENNTSSSNKNTQGGMGNYAYLDLIDGMNNIDDRFTIAPAINAIQALRFENSSYKAYLEHLSLPSNKYPYYRLECTTNPSQTSHPPSSTNNSSIQSGSLSTVSAFVNDSFATVFGYDSNLIAWYHQYLQGGILPFGGDILALIMDDVKNIQRCIHRITMKTRQSLAMIQSQLNPNTTLCQTFETQFSIGNNDYPLRIKLRNRDSPDFLCMCQILFRNVIHPDLSSAGTQMHISFVPILQQGIPPSISSIKPIQPSPKPQQQSQQLQQLQQSLSPPPTTSFPTPHQQQQQQQQPNQAYMQAMTLQNGPNHYQTATQSQFRSFTPPNTLMIHSSTIIPAPSSSSSSSINPNQPYPIPSSTPNHLLRDDATDQYLLSSPSYFSGVFSPTSGSNGFKFE